MPLIEEKFDQSRIDTIRRYLQREAEKGRAKDYEILVDGFKIVSRTDRLEEFEDYEAEIKPGTRNVSILVFDGQNTNRNTRYSFVLQGEPQAVPSKTQNGLGEIDQMIQEKLEAKDREYELQHLREKLEETEAALQESEDYNTQLEDFITSLKEKKGLENLKMVDVLYGAFETIVKKNAHRIPLGAELAGLLGGEDGTALPPASEDTKASFEKKQATPQELDEMTRNRLQLITDMQAKLNEQQMVGVFSIIGKLTERTQLIETVIELLNENPKQ